MPVRLKLSQRPRLLNPLHALGLVEAYSQMTAEERDCLERHAAGKHLALEIGTFMGVSATRIARALSAEGKLYCVDPWEALPGRANPCFLIARRELRRKGVLEKIVFVRGRSGEVAEKLPEGFDFMFVDGDHSYEGIEIDWAIARRRLVPGGVVCLHDTSIPEDEPWRNFGSVRFFDHVIRYEGSFRHLERCYSMNVLQRIA